MKITKIMLGAALALSTAACTMTDGAIATTTRAAPQAAGVLVGATAPSYSVQKLNVNVPRSLIVSESNSFVPSGDIVWRGDPYGDRYQQIEAILREGMGRGIKQMRGQQDVIVDIELTRFHSLTERTRYSVGGNHAIHFLMTVRDAKTGAVVQGPRLIKADLKGFGGEAAIQAERAGQTQKVRITDHLSRVIVQQLSAAPTA